MAFKVLCLPAFALALAALAVGAGPAPASDHYLQGRQLYNLCTSNMGGKGRHLEAGECVGFIVGVSDTFDCVEASHGLHWNPHEAGNSHMVLVTTVLQWLDAHPDAMDKQAHRAVSAALQQRFPCK